MPSSPKYLLRILIPAGLAFIAIVGTVLVIRLETPETAANRLNTLTFGPTLNEAMGRGWQEVSWQQPSPPSQNAATFRQGVLFLDVLTAVRARQRAIIIELLNQLEEACSKGPEASQNDDLGALLQEIVAIRSQLEDGGSFDSARARLLTIEPQLEQINDPEPYRLGLFLEQGRLTFEHGKMAPRSWERELDAYLADPELAEPLRTRLRELQSVPTRSGKMAVLELLLERFGDGVSLSKAGAPPATEPDR